MSQNSNDGDEDYSDTPGSKRGGRPSILPLSKQKQLITYVVDLGGIHKASTDKVLEKAGIVKGTPEFKAAQNKINNCRSRPLAYERLQLDLFKSIVDNSSVKSPPRQTRLSTAAVSSKKEAPLTPETPQTVSPKQTVSSKHRATPERATTEPLKDLSSLFQQMNINNFFGEVDWDEELNVNLDKPWKNRDVLVFKTSSVLVGVEPMISTNTITVALATDKRWFTDGPDDFEPFVGTQIGWNEVVIEYPRQSFDFMCGPVPTQSGVYEANKLSWVLRISDEAQEQIEYEIVRNQLIHAQDKNKHWRFKLKLKFDKAIRLDYSLVDKSKHKGAIEYSICDGPSACVKWRIASVPDDEEDRTLFKKKKAEPTAKEKYRQMKLAKKNKNIKKEQFEKENEDDMDVGEESKHPEMEDFDKAEAIELRRQWAIREAEQRKAEIEAKRIHDEEERAALTRRRQQYEEEAARRAVAQMGSPQPIGDMEGVVEYRQRNQKQDRPTLNPAVSPSGLPIEQDDAVLMEGRADVWDGDSNDEQSINSQLSFSNEFVQGLSNEE